MVNKNNFKTSNEGKNTLEEADASLLKSTIKRRLPKWRHRECIYDVYSEHQEDHHNPTEHVFQLLHTNLNAERPTNKQKERF